MRKARTLRLTCAAAALAALGVIGFGGSASATKAPAKTDVTTITMEFNRADRDIFFDGPRTVAAGDQLKIKNNTNPRAVGPHTFSLVREADLPRTNEQIKACAKKFTRICGAIAKWHELDFETGQVHENPVDVGKQGWDQKGSLKRKGDSWFTQTKGERFQRKVTAPAGKSLSFICAVHPAMQGKINVVEG